ncbi:hypothetical protein B4144_2402 [Bacillus atrophaeus]|nr:hypothetical protein B4144_2402 [Bacillus atrophaeus]
MNKISGCPFFGQPVFLSLTLFHYFSLRFIELEIDICYNDIRLQ